MKRTALSFSGTSLKPLCFSLSLSIGLVLGFGPTLASALIQDRDDSSTNLAPAEAQDQPEPEATSLLGTPLYRIELSQEQKQRLEKNLEEARATFEQTPTKAENVIWLGRRLAYLWRYREAIDVFSQGIENHPQDARLLRHRGHRFITTRNFAAAIADFKRAVELIEGSADEVEPDGAPNSAGIPTSTLHTNIWYHLGLAYYLSGDFESALAAYRECLAAAKNNDMRVATLDWMYMTLRRLGRHAEALDLIAEVTPELEIIENVSYHRRLLMYRGLLKPEDLLANDQSELTELELATQGYGVANWYLMEGDRDKARAILKQVIGGRHWSAFGYIAAEVELAGEQQSDQVEAPDRR